MPENNATRYFRPILRILIWTCCSCLLMVACRSATKPTRLDDILTANEITVITRNNPWCYYQYRNQPMGFEFELAQAFADYIGVRLKVAVVDRWDRMIPDLIEGKGDFIAASMAITPDRQAKAAFSAGYLPVRQRIIVHRQNSNIKEPKDLAHKTVHVSRGTLVHQQLEALKASGVDMKIELHQDLEATELIRMVAEKSIDITIADDLTAMLAYRYYPQIVISGSINERAPLGWAVNPQSRDLLAQINTFMSVIKKNGEFDRIYHRYYSESDRLNYVDLRAFHRGVKKALPKYLLYLQPLAKQYGFDWRLIAAQMYQESQYNPLSISHRGAHGLMQISSKTAESLGVMDIYDPSENIEAGIRHLKTLFDFYDKAQGEDRLNIALAAYNVGMGHILDARNIARQQDLDPNKWSSLVKTLPLLSQPEYYQETKYGYSCGTEPIGYINKINTYYDILKYQSVVAEK